MKRMRQLLAGVLTAAMVVATGIPAQAASLDESQQAGVKTEMVQDDTLKGNPEEAVQDDAPKENPEEAVKDDTLKENPEEAVQDNTPKEDQEGAAQDAAAGENLEETVQIDANEDTKTADETAEDGSDEPIAAYGLTRVGETFTIQNVASKKYIKTYSTGPLTVDGEANDPDILFKDVKYKTDYLDMLVCNFISNSYNNGMNSGLADYVQVQGGDGIGGWESIRFIPNGDGTISFRATNEANGAYITVVDNDQMVRNSGLAADNLTDKEKYIITYETAPNNAVENLELKDTTIDSITLAWENRDDRDVQSIYTNNILYWKGSSEAEYTNKKNVGVSTSCQIRGLKTGSYDFKLVTVNGQGDPLNDTVASEGIELENCSTKLYRVPETPTNIEMEQLGSGNLKLSWNASKYADYYVIQHGESRFDTGYTDMTAEDGSLIATTDTSIEVTLSENPYQDYYRVVAVSGGNAR